MTLSQKRIGNFTASCIHKLVKGPRGGTGVRDTYIFEKAEERVKGHAKGFSNKYTEHGHLNEQEALQAFTEVTGLQVEYLMQEYFEINANFGATPDGKVVDFSGSTLASLDVKCPSETFFQQKMELINECKPEYQNVKKEYYYQAQAQMMALGVGKHYLVWYLTAMESDYEGNKVEYNLPLETRIFYKVIKADFEAQQMLLNEVDQAAKERDALVQIFLKPILPNG